MYIHVHVHVHVVGLLEYDLVQTYGTHLSWPGLSMRSCGVRLRRCEFAGSDHGSTQAGATVGRARESVRCATGRGWSREVAEGMGEG